MRRNRRDTIVFLDSGTIDYGDVSLREIERLGFFKTYRNTGRSQIQKRIRGARIVITNKFEFNETCFRQAPHLQCLCVTATGTNNVDLATARKYGVAVTNVAGYSTESVVQFTFLFILAMASRLSSLTSAVKRGEWSRSPFFTLASSGTTDISGKTLGIIGFGTIGRRVARIAGSFGMNVMVARIPGRKYSRNESAGRSDFRQVIRKADYLTIHAPLTPLTEDLINERIIRMMKKSARIINMARGGIVNEAALRNALSSGQLSGAACDVLTQEPPSRRHVLLGAPNLILTPHVAWATLESRRRLITEIALNIKAFQAGKKRNRVV